MDSEITVLFDEAHELPKDVTNAFLTIFNTERGHTRDFRWRDGQYPFDFRQQTFLFATTEPDKLFPPLKDRLTTVDFEDYEPFELAQILESQVEDISFEEKALLEVARTSRGNARDCVKVAKELEGWCAANDTKIFRLKDFELNFVMTWALIRLELATLRRGYYLFSARTVRHRCRSCAPRQV